MSAGPEQIAEAVALLKRGGLVAFPTETVYGLGADALDPEAVLRVFELKGRPSSNPLIVHVSGEDMAGGVCGSWTAEAQQLTRAFWPGPLTLVLPKQERVPENVTAGGQTVAVRMPAHALTLGLIEAFGGPLVGPSANPSGSVSPTEAEHVRAAFGNRAPYVLDGGACERGIESTVLDLTSERPTVLRPGVIGAEEIAGVLGSEVAEHAGASAKSPGTAGPHYQPASDLAVVDRLDDLPEDAVAIVRAGSDAESGSGGAGTIELPADATGFAAGLYRAIREADALGPGLIAVQRPPADALGAEAAVWHAVAERLGRAAR